MSEYEVAYTMLHPKYTVKYATGFGYPVKTDHWVSSDEFKYVQPMSVSYVFSIFCKRKYSTTIWLVMKYHGGFHR